MCSRHVEPGAGAEYAEPLSNFDTSCDYCARTIYSGLLRQVTIGGSTSLLCSTCFERQEAEYRRMTGAAS